MKSSTSRWLALSGAALLAAVLFLLATLPSNDYLFVPNGAHAIAGKVAVQGKDAPEGSGGIYYVDVTVRKVRWIERLLPFTRPDGASLVPPQAVTAPGESFSERVVEARAEMQRSEQIAAAVALEAGGLDVRTTPRGVLVEAVAVDVPAAKTLSSGDLIVGRRRPQGDDGRAAAPRHTGSPTGRRTCGSACGGTARSSGAPLRRSPRRTTRSGRSSASASRRTPRSSCR